MEAGAYKFDPDRNQRNQSRISHRELGWVSLAIRLCNGDGEEGAWVQAKLWDFTSISFGVLLPTWSPETAPQVGQVIRLRLGISETQSHEVECQVKNLREQDGALRLGLRRLDLADPREAREDRRDSLRLRLPPGTAFGARIRHPYIYGYWSALDVVDINKHMGFSFESRDAAALVFSGMTIEVHFELSGMRGQPMLAKVAWVQATGSHRVRFGVACLDMAFELHNRICDTLFLSRQWSPARLREAGFHMQSVKSRLRFRTVKTMEDYAEVLYLRRDAYVRAGKRPQGTRPEAMAGPLDGKSRIIMAWHGDLLVGTMTFTFPDSEATVLDSQAGFPGAVYPIALPPKTQMIEVSRLCIHEGYRSTDLLQGLFEHGLQHFLASDRKWLLSSAVDELMPLYKRIGFRRLRATYSHPSLNHLKHHLILAHRNAFLFGQGVNIWVWNGLFGEVIRFMLQRHPALFSRFQLWRARLRLSLGPLARRLAKNRLEAAFRKHMQVMRQQEA